MDMIVNTGSTTLRRSRRSGFSLIELLIVVAIILIIAAIAIPSLMRSRIAANEASAVGSMRTFNTALASYALTYGGGFATSLSDLGPASVPSSAAADLIDSVLVTGSKSGYSFSYTPGPVASSGHVTSYSITAVPIASNISGVRKFYTDNSLVIRSTTTGTPSSSDPPIS